MLPSTPRSSQWSPSIRSLYQNPVCTPSVPHTCHISFFYKKKSYFNKSYIFSRCYHTSFRVHTKFRQNRSNRSSKVNGNGQTALIFLLYVCIRITNMATPTVIYFIHSGKEDIYSNFQDTLQRLCFASHNTLCTSLFYFFRLR